MSDNESTQQQQHQEPQGTEEQQQQQQDSGSGNEETPSTEDLLAELEEWKGHARKWEDRAKENKDAKDELDRAARERMSDDERVKADLQDLTAERDEATSRAEKAEAALNRYKIAVEYGLTDEDATALESVSDEQALRTLAERLSTRSTGPRPNPHQGTRHTKATGPATSSDLFVEAVEGLFN